MRRMAIIVTSCDSYQDLWEPFFRLMDVYWNNCCYPVYLNTETIPFNKEYENFKVQALNLVSDRNPKRISWSKRMLDVLDRIEEEYVFILVDDFFLRENVQGELIEQLLDKMDEDKAIGQIQLFGTRTNCDAGQPNHISDSIQMEQIGDDKAKVCFVPTIWRRATLKRWMRPWESIWGFEGYGAQRARRWRYRETVIRVYSPAIFNYLWEKDCYCVVNGKWMVHPLLNELFRNHDIEIDYEARGTITMDEWNKVDMGMILKRYSVAQIASKTFNRIRSYF